MKKVCFLLPDGMLKPSSLFAAVEVFEKANEYLMLRGGEPYYDVQIAGTPVSQGLLNAQFAIRTADVAGIPRPDLIIIPGLHEQNSYATANNRTLIEWMTTQYKEGAELASLCTGAFLLAATGLLKQRECSTHWKAEQAFLDLFPDVRLRTDKIITDNKGIYTAGGATSSLNLILYLVEKYNGRATAVYCAKVLQIDIERNSQSPFILFEGQKSHGDDDIRNIQQFIETNLAERITVESLAERFAISRRSLVRRFRKATNNPPVEYIQRVKVEAAKRGLEQQRKNVNEVMYSVGYTDLKAFRTIFKKITGLTPQEYRLKFSES